MYITLYYIVTRLPDSLHPRTPVFEGCSPSPLLPSVAFSGAADLVGFESIGAASGPSGRRRTGKGKGGKGAGGARRGGGGGGGGSGGGGGGGGSGGRGGGVDGSSGGGGGGGGGGGSGGGGGGGGGGGDGGGGGGGGSGAALRRGVAPVVVRASSSSAAVRPCPPSSFVSGTLCVSAVGVLVPAPTAGVAIFDLDYDAILAAMYAVSDSVEGECYLCVPPHSGIVAAALGAGEAAALGASVSAASGAGESALSGTTSAQAVHTFILDSGASRSFFEDRTTLTPLSRPVVVSLADPSGGTVFASFSTVLPCPGAPSGTLLGLYLPSFSTNLGHERYFLLVVDDYSRYTTVFPLRSKGDVTEVLIDWIRAARLQLKESFGSDFPVLRLHSDRGGEFSSARLGAFCRAQGIRQTFTLPASQQQNGIAERRIGMVMDVARTSMIHAATPHFPWPFAVLYAAHQLNLHPQVSLPETSPTLGWTRKVGDASAFRVWGSRAFVRDLSADKLSPRAAPCVFLGFPPHAPWWQFYHPTSRRPPRVDPLPPQGFALSGVSQVDEVEPVKVAVDSGAARGAEPAGAASGGAGPEGAERAGAEPGGAKSGGAEPGGAESGGAKRGCAEPGGAGSARLAARYASSRREPLSPRELRKWLARRLSRAARAGDTTVAAGPGGTAGAAGGIGAAGPARARAAGGVGAGGSAGAGASKGARVGAVGGGGTAGAGAAAGGIGAVLAGSGGTVRPRPYLPQSQLQLASPLLAPSPYTGPTGGLAEHREPASRPALPVRAARTSRRALRLLPPAVPGTHHMALRPSTAPLRVPLPSPPNSSLPLLAHPESDSLPAASPIVTRLLTTVVSDPSFESTAASALVAELVKFAARCRQDYAASLVAESEFVCPPSVGGECALSTDVLEERDPDELDIPTPRSYAEAIEGPYSSQWQSAMDAEMASWKSTGTYVDEVPPPGANIVSGLWIFRVNWPTGSPRVFKARYVARGFSQHQGVDYFQTFSPTPKMTTLQVLLHIAAQRDYELHSLDLSTAFLQGSLHEEIWLCRPPGFTGSFPPGTQWSLRRPVYGLRQAPHEWHDTLRTTLVALGFAPSTADPSLFLRTDTSLPPLDILMYVENLVFATADAAGLAHVKSELQKRHTCTDLGELRSYLGL
ncbi:unnamed protein product [Closterium sp. NIES-64]|nr:unnamed protein product [Closterium sp. NIES-64]